MDSRMRPDKLGITMALALGASLVIGAGVARYAFFKSERTVAPALPQPRATLSPVIGLSVAAHVDIVADGATYVIARHGRDRSYGTETAKIGVPKNGHVSTTIIGLAAGAVSHVEVVAYYSDRDVRRTEDLTVATPPLEPSVPDKLELSVAKGAPAEVLMLSMNRGEAGGGLAVVVNRAGRVVWYRRSGSGGPSAFDRLPNGHFILHQFEKQAFEELDLDGTVVRIWRDEKSITGSDGHDFRPLPNGNALLFGAETHPVDSRKSFPGGAAHALRWDDTVSELTPGGAVLWRWSSWLHVSESEITQDPSEPFDPRDYEVVHTNSIETLPDGNLILSFRNTGTVAKVDRRTGAVVWRLGGKQSDFRIEGDSLGGFHRQHDARLIGTDGVLLFDNGNFHDPPESRAVEYRLDETSKVATLVWQYRKSPPAFAPISGSVERLPNGNTLISWGPGGIVSEIETSGAVVWEAKTSGYGVYRARAARALYP
jgi:hypothetical protein